MLCVDPLAPSVPSMCVSWLWDPVQEASYLQTISMFISALSCLWGRLHQLLERFWEYCCGRFCGTQMHVSPCDGWPFWGDGHRAVVTVSISFPSPCIPSKMGRTMSVCVSWLQRWEDLVQSATATSSSQCQADLTNNSYTGDECLMSILLMGQGALTGGSGKSKED